MSLVVRVIAPTGRDASLITRTLLQHGVSAETVTIASLMEASSGGSLGPLLVAEEALTPGVIRALATLLEHQPPWSDLPLLILTGSGRETFHSSRVQTERLPLGSPVLLERPIRTATLLSSVKAALRARARQYEVRDAVAALQEEREILQAMLDNIPVGVVLANSSGTIVRGNRRLEEILRHPLRPSQDVDAYSEWVAFHSDGSRVRGDQFPLSRAMRTGRAIPAEAYLYERGDGTRAWVSLTAAPILGERGVVKGGVVAISDIDQQRRAEAALIQNEKLAAVGRLAASISHEINNPLEAVTNLLYLARLDSSLSQDTRELLASADQELTRVSQIVSHTLRFHRQSTRPSPLTPEELLAPTLGLYAGRIRNANIRLNLQHRTSALVTCHEGEIRQVFNNLIGNACEAMKLGGTLTVRTSDACMWKTKIRGVRFTIADTGHGVEPEILQNIFDAFFTTKGANGTGLGLWISKGIVEKHQGSLRVYSRVKSPGSGTVFSLFLPSDPVLPVA